MARVGPTDAQKRAAAKLYRQVRSGARAAIAEAEAAARARPASQLPLLPVTADDPAPAPGELDEGRGPGRPPGSGNKAAGAWRDYFLAHFPSPLVGLAVFAFRDTLDLSEELQCSPLEAAEFQRRCMTDILPYVNQKLPQMVELAERKMWVLRFEFGGGAGAGMPDAGELATSARVIEARPDDIEQNQELSDVDSADLDRGHSDNAE